MKDQTENELNYDASQYRTPDGITSDIVIFTLLPKQNDAADVTDDPSALQLHVLLIQRKNWPFAGAWAFPGGFCDPDETIYECAQRELYEETAIKDVHVAYSNVYSKPGRDPRGWMISHAFYALVAEDRLLDRRAADDAADVRLFPVADVLNMDLAFDHNEILADALREVQNKMLTTPLARVLLRPHFTLAELSAVIRAVFQDIDQNSASARTKLANDRIEWLEEVKIEAEGEVGAEKMYRFTDEVPQLSIYHFLTDIFDA